MKTAHWMERLERGRQSVGVRERLKRLRGDGESDRCEQADGNGQIEKEKRRESETRKDSN